MGSRLYNTYLVVANILFGVSYSVVVALLEQRNSPDQIFVAQTLFGAIIFLPRLRLSLLLRHLPHLLRNTIILLFGWQRLTLIGTEHTPALTIAAISLLGLAITLLAARNIHRLRIFCTPLMAAILLLPHLRVPPSAYIFVGIISVAISTILSRDMVRQMGAESLLGGYLLLATLLLPLLLPQPLTLPSLSWALLYQLTLGSALPLLLLLKGSAYTTPLRTALARYLQSAVTIFVSYFPIIPPR